MDSDDLNITMLWDAVDEHIQRVAPLLLQDEEQLQRWLNSVARMMAETDLDRALALAAEAQRVDLRRLIVGRLHLQRLRARFAALRSWTQ